MCPQPLSQIRPAVHNYSFGTDAIAVRGELVGIVALIIAGWAVTEAHLGHVFATLIGAKKPVTMKMYAAIDGFALRKVLLQTAADDMLPAKYSTMFRIGLTILNRHADYRNKFAHRIWGAAQEPHMNDALLLVDPKHFWHLRIARIRHGQRHGPTDTRGALAYLSYPQIEQTKVFVYRKQELLKIYEDMERAYRIADALVGLAGSDSRRRRALYQWLSREPDVAELLEAERQRQIKRPANAARR